MQIYNELIWALESPVNIIFCFADVSIDMPDLLDISHLRARGLQPGEEELPDISPPIVIPDDSKGTISYWKDTLSLPPSSSQEELLFHH